MLVASRIPLPFSAPCDDMLTVLVCATCWLYMHLYTLAYMSMRESCSLVCHPYFNTMKLWTSNPNLHLFPTNTTFCRLSCLFALLLVCFLYCFFACHIYHAFFGFHVFIANVQKLRFYQNKGLSLDKRCGVLNTFPTCNQTSEPKNQDFLPSTLD